MYKRKSAVDLTDLAIGIVMLGIVVTIGALVLTNLAGNRRGDLTVITTTNETLTTVEDTGELLTNAWVQSVSSCTNATAGGDIPANNYTVTISDVDGYGLVQYTGGAASGWNNSNWNCTYNYYNTSSRADYQLANDAATGIAEYGNWFDIIVIVGIAGLILALIFMAFGQNKGAEYGGGVSY